MFTFIIFMSLFGVAIYFTSSFTKNASLQKRQILFLTRQNNELKSKLDEQVSFSEPLVINYRRPHLKNGIVIYNCNLYAAPTKKSPLLGTLEKNMNLTVLDSAEVLGTLWYEISFNLRNNINNKGWIISVNIQLIDSLKLQTPN